MSSDNIEVIKDSAWLFLSESIVVFCSIFNGILPLAFGRGLAAVSALPAVGLLTSLVFLEIGTAGFLEAAGSIFTYFFYITYFSLGFFTSLDRVVGSSC